jgi:hypothetical protein
VDVAGADLEEKGVGYDSLEIPLATAGGQTLPLFPLTREAKKIKHQDNLTYLIPS